VAVYDLAELAVYSSDPDCMGGRSDESIMPRSR